MDLSLRFLIPNNIFSMISLKVLITVLNPEGKVIFPSDSGYFPSFIFKRSSENVHASSQTYSHIFCKEEFFY